jgi:hypothetical protein
MKTVVLLALSAIACCGGIIAAEDQTVRIGSYYTDALSHYRAFRRQGHRGILAPRGMDCR